MAPLEEGHPRPLRKCNIEPRVMMVTRWRRDIETEDRDVEEIVDVDGECTRLGESWTSRF